MRIAILGATSQIAKDLVLSFDLHANHELQLFARRTESLKQWIDCAGLNKLISIGNFENFSAEKPFDAVLNFIGVGNPARAVAMGAAIFDATLKYDEMVLNYLRKHPDCRYVFLSSGAAYGSSFEQPVGGDSRAVIPINKLHPQDWYAVAKLYAECRHRALQHLAIVDIRVFNYFSHTQDISARFFITDILRTIRSGETLQTSSDNIVRDYIGPTDFYQLVSRILASPAINEVIDCYTLEPVDKMTLLAKMKEHFGLKYEVSNKWTGIDATGSKMNYFSSNRRAEIFGYMPQKSSLQTVLNEVSLALSIADSE